MWATRGNRMSRNTLIAMGGGGLSAIASMIAITGLPGALLFIYLAPLPLMLVGLGLGTTAATMAGISGFVIVGLLGGIMAAGLYAVAHAMPTWLVVRQSLLQIPGEDGAIVWYPVGYILCWLASFGALVMLFAAVINVGGAGSLETSVGEYLNYVFEAVAPAMPAADRQSVALMLTPLFPGMAAISWLSMVALNAIFAQSILRRGNRNLRPGPSLTNLRLPDWISWMLVASAAIALLKVGDMEYLGRNMATVLAVPFFFLGLSVVHDFARHVGSPGALLAVFYLVMFFFGGALLVVAGVGIVEQWVGLRRHFPHVAPKAGD